MGFRERWIKFLYRAATGTKKTRTLLTPIGVTIFCLFTALFVLVNVWELKEIYEPELMKRLGDEYIEYRRQTPMFIPGRRPRSKSNT